MRMGLVVHDELLRSTVAMHGGHVFSTRGMDSVLPLRGRSKRFAPRSSRRWPSAGLRGPTGSRSRSNGHAHRRDRRAGRRLLRPCGQPGRARDGRRERGTDLGERSNARGPAGRSCAGRAMGRPRLPRPPRRHRARPPVSRRVSRVHERQPPAAVRQRLRGQPTHRRVSALRSIRRRRLDRRRACTQACRDPHGRGRCWQDTVGARGWPRDAGDPLRRSVVCSARHR